MTNFTRNNGANARAQRWDELYDEQTERTGSWLPLDALDQADREVGPPLRPVPPKATRLASAGSMEAVQPTTAYPRMLTRGAAQSRTDGQQGGQGTQAGVPARAVAMLAGVAVCALAAYVAVSAAVQWTQVKLDDLQYGRPRTTQLDAFVGHGEAEGVPTHFIAINLNRRVTIIEMPGGDGSKASTITGPYLFGEGEDLTPVQAAAQDVNLDGAPDLLVTIKNEQLLYLNDGQSFKLITPEEKATLQKTLASPAEPGSGQGTVEEAGK